MYRCLKNPTFLFLLLHQQIAVSLELMFGLEAKLTATEHVANLFRAIALHRALAIADTECIIDLTGRGPSTLLANLWQTIEF